MATSGPSSLFISLANVWRCLSLRSDVDSIILELLGQFSLEKIYADGDKETYQGLVVNLIAQLNAIFYIQRLSLPSEHQNGGWYLGYLVSWEVAMRAVELVLQIVVEGRESLWEADQLRDKYLAEMLLSALRVLTLHPKAPTNHRAKDRRERFARVHRSLERIYDSYPGSKSFLLMVCKEVTDSLRTEPNALILPARLRYELPNLATELYPLPECVSPHCIATIVPQDGYSEDWLAQFLALRDVSQFVVAASIQYSVNRESRQVGLQSASARSRNAVLNALENLRMPAHLQKLDLLATFSDTFRIILPDTLQLIRRDSAEPRTDEAEMDALDILCSRLSDRQVVHRVSDRELVHGVSEITRNIGLLDDPTSQARSSRPRIFALNCNMCHVVGESQLRSLGNIKVSINLGESGEFALPEHSTCTHCGESITLLREIPLARHAWELLKPLEPNADTINVERHLPTLFQLGPPKCDTGIPLRPSYGNIMTAAGPLSPMSPDTEVFSPTQFRPVFSSGSNSPDPARSLAALPPGSPGFRQRLDTAQTDVSRSDHLSSHEASVEAPLPLFSTTSLISSVVDHPPLNRHDTSSSFVPIDPVPISKNKSLPPAAPPEKTKSRWRSKLSGSRKESFAPSVDTSSLSSTSLEAQRLDEISLKNLTSSQKVSSRGRGGKSISIFLSQNSTYALFWTQPLIHLWDIGTSPPSMKREFATDGNCVLAAVTKMHLAYMIGTRDQKLTLRIINLNQQTNSVVEYRMSSSVWCKSIAICSRENYVVVGFENSTVRFFRTTNSEPIREDRLHARLHVCKECPAVDSLSFSHDGLVLVASTRNPKTGYIQLYSWRFPFTNFQELPSCRYQVPLHESEDNGVTSAIYRAGPTNEDDLVCITTWTQSGTPLLIQPQGGHRSFIKNESSGRPGRLGNRIQCAAFSRTGRDIAMVNDKGHLYQISGLNSNPMDVRRIATSKELTAKSDSFGMSFMTLPDEEAIVLAWVDMSKGVGFVKKIPVAYNNGDSDPTTPGFVHVYPTTSVRAELQGDDTMPRKHLANLTISEEPVEIQIDGPKGYK